MLGNAIIKSDRRSFQRLTNLEEENVHLINTAM